LGLLSTISPTCKQRGGHFIKLSVNPETRSLSLRNADIGIARPTPTNPISLPSRKNYLGL
jgi:hypothetical protein